MNKNQLKLRNIQEANKAMERRLLSEQTVGPKKSLSKDLEPGDTVLVVDKDNKQNSIQVIQTLPGAYGGGFIGFLNKRKTPFTIGPKENQLGIQQLTEPGDYVFTVEFVELNGQRFPVAEDGSF